MSGRGHRHLDNGAMIGAAPLRISPCALTALTAKPNFLARLQREIVKVVAGDFEVRLAATAAEIDAAQALRYRVFTKR